jgi:hypothetical protein
MIRALGYVVGFATAFVVIFAGLYAALLLLIGALSFIAWSVPLVSPFNLVVLRIFVVLSTIISVLFLLSREGQEALDSFETGFKKGRK